MKEISVCKGCKFVSEINPLFIGSINPGEYRCTRVKRAWELTIKGKDCFVKLKDK